MRSWRSGRRSGTRARVRRLFESAARRQRRPARRCRVCAAQALVRWRMRRCICRSTCAATPISTHRRSMRPTSARCFADADNALPPNWLHIPIGYNGRASTVVVSGTDVRRPWGQLKAPDADAPRFAPCERFDIELELGAIVGMPTTLGETLTVAQAYEKIFGYVLLNDWSARDIQTWEYQPLGPFQSKATATTISPWVVTRDALEPFRVATPERVKPLLAYLAVKRRRTILISPWRSSWRRVARRRRSAGPTIAACIFRARSSWRITQRRAARCALAICSARARFQARSRAAMARCSSCRGAARSRSNSPMGRCARSCADGDRVTFKAQCEDGRCAHRLRYLRGHRAAGGRGGGFSGEACRGCEAPTSGHFLGHITVTATKPVHAPRQRGIKSHRRQHVVSSEVHMSRRSRHELCRHPQAGAVTQACLRQSLSRCSGPLGFPLTRE